MAKTADVIVVGGGVMGTSVAWQLAQRGAGRIVLLEKSFLGAGSSGKSGAIIRQHYSNRLTTAMARHGLKVFRQFPDAVGGRPVFTHTGMAIVVPAASRVALEHNVTMQRDVGVDVRLVSQEDLRELDPQTHVADDEVVAYEFEAGFVEAMDAVAGFADAASRNGAEIRQGVEVLGIEVSGGRVRGVRTTEGHVACRTVVLAAGPWAARVASTAGVSLPVNPCRTQVAWIRRPADFTEHLSVYGDFSGEVYFKPTYGDMVHVGTISPNEANDVVDPDHCPEVPDEGFLVDCHRKLGRRVPPLLRGPRRGGMAALYSITPDWHPILDRLPGVQGAYCAVGFSGHGFKMAPAVGSVLTELIVEGAATTFDIHPLRATRFEENDPVTSPYEYGVLG